jgi:ZIP family zinc transporter
MSVLCWSLAAVVSTAAGGLFALRARARLRGVLAIATVALLAFVCFELVPESIEWAQRSGAGAAPLAAAAAGFAFFALTDRLVLRGWVPAGALVGHSFLDGMGIGVAFQLSPAFGLAVAAPVVAHDFLDGVNTVGLMLMHRNATAPAFAMLALDALAPLAGAASTLAWQLPPAAMAGYLGFFAGLLASIAVVHLRRFAAVAL